MCTLVCFPARLSPLVGSTVRTRTSLCSPSLVLRRGRQLSTARVMAQSNIVVVGAGVVGLTTALRLSSNPKYSVTIVAKHMPGDYDIDYASPWAGANYLPVSKEGTPGEQHERNTWPELARLAKDVPEAGVHFQNTIVYNRKKDLSGTTGQWFQDLLKEEPWFKDVVPGFRALPSEELPAQYDSATTFTSVCINTAIYLPWLASQCLKNGATIERAILAHISEAANLHRSGKKADVIVNCTGLGAAKLGGVEDSTVVPARGQIVVVRNDPKVMASVSGTDDSPDETTYVMHRAAGGGTVLGGCYQKGSWESQPDPNLANRIMKRSVELCPALTGGKGVEALSVVRHSVGLRPTREAGTRVDREKIDGNWVVHCYGHGGYGYQASYGSAEAAVELVDGALQ